MTQARDLADGKFDTDTLVVDATNDAVGVGTTSPDNNLEVSGSGTVARITSDNANVYLRLKNSSNDGGYLGYESSAVSLWSGSSKRITVDSDGLKFGSDTAAANALDDYETGSVTLTYTGDSNPTVVYNQQAAEYVKIGDFVIVCGRLRTSSVSAQGSGTLRISGLPFTVDSGQIWGSVNIGYATGWPSGNHPATGYATPATTQCDLIKSDSDPRDGLDTSVSAASLNTGDGNDLIFNITYKTS